MIISWVKRDESVGTRFLGSTCVVVTGSVSSDNLSAFDVIGNKVHKIAGNIIVSIGNE